MDTAPTVVAPTDVARQASVGTTSAVDRAPDTNKTPVVWVLKCHRAGDHAQSLGLARALGWPFIVKEMEFHWYEIFFALAARITLIGLDRRKSDPLTAPWPDLVIMAGRRNETPAKWIRQQSGGKSRIVLIGRYWTPPRDIDLVVTTHQFRLPAHPHTLHNDFPLHPTTPERVTETAKLWAPRLSDLPGPYVALMVGGSSGPYVFSRETARRLGQEASALARSLGASLLVTTSARTGSGPMKALKAAIDVPCHFHPWQPNDPDNPYFGFLGLADTMIVTADSMSMLAEASMTGRPVYMFEFGGGPAAMHGPRSAADPRIRQWWRWSQLKDQGVRRLLYGFAIGLPAWRLNRSRDIRRVQDIFITSGRVQWLTNPKLPPLTPAPLEDIERAVVRVRQLLDNKPRLPIAQQIVAQQPGDHPLPRLVVDHAPSLAPMQALSHAPHQDIAALPVRPAPRIWLVLSDKAGDNVQVQAIADALPWPSELKRITVREPFVLGKPKVGASLNHVDIEQSDRLEGPWPDLILTSGRRMSMVALWIQDRAREAIPGHQTKIVLVGLPKGHIDRFSLAVVSEQYRQSRHANLMRISYPLQRLDEVAIANAATQWRDSFAQHSRPLIAVMVGGRTGAVRFDAAVAARLTKDLTELARREGGTLVVTTSRRTPPEVVAVLQRDLPAGTVLHLWTPNGAANPYSALLGLADRFVVTSDSLSMLMEVARLGRPLAIYPLPLATWLGDRVAATGLNRLLPAAISHPLSRLFGAIVTRLGRVSHHRDLTALHRLLIKDKLAVWFGEPFRLDGERPVDDLSRVVIRITDLMKE
jgi:hypothetical protein